MKKVRTLYYLLSHLTPHPLPAEVQELILRLTFLQNWSRNLLSCCTTCTMFHSSPLGWACVWLWWCIVSGWQRWRLVFPTCLAKIASYHRALKLNGRQDHPLVPHDPLQLSSWSLVLEILFFQKWPKFSETLEFWKHTHLPPNLPLKNKKVDFFFA